MKETKKIKKIEKFPPQCVNGATLVFSEAFGEAFSDPLETKTGQGDSHVHPHLRSHL